MPIKAYCGITSTPPWTKGYRDCTQVHHHGLENIETLYKPSLYMHTYMDKRLKGLYKSKPSWTKEYWG